MNRTITTPEQSPVAVELLDDAGLSPCERLPDAELSDRIHNAFQHSPGLLEAVVA